MLIYLKDTDDEIEFETEEFYSCIISDYIINNNDDDEIPYFCPPSKKG